MGKKEAPDDEPEGAPEWIVTFSDLVSLLVTLFIMLLAFSSQETHDLNRAVNIIKGSFGVLGDTVRDAAEMLRKRQMQANVEGGVRKFDPDDDPNAPLHVRKLEGFVIEGDDLDKGARIVPKTMTGFAPGSALPSTPLAQEFRKLARSLLKHKKRRFRIEGFTDAESDKESEYPDQVALSLARARKVARIMGLEGLPLEQVEVVARAANAPRGEKWNREGQARNRRVELVVEKASKKADQASPGQGK